MKHKLLFLTILMGSFSSLFCQNEILDIRDINQKNQKKFNFSIDFGRETSINKLSSEKLEVIDPASGVLVSNEERSKENIDNYNSTYKDKFYKNYVGISASYCFIDRLSIKLGFGLYQFHRDILDKETKEDYLKFYTSSVAPMFKLGLGYSYPLNSFISLNLSPMVKYMFQKSLKYDIIYEDDLTMDDNKIGCKYSQLQWSVPIVCTFKLQKFIPFVGAVYSDYVYEQTLSMQKTYVGSVYDVKIKSKSNSDSKFSGIAGLGFALSDNISISAVGTFGKVISGQLSINVSL